ncbi:MAG: helicase-related protein [Erysipelotrichaceae bacterium]
MFGRVNVDEVVNKVVKLSVNNKVASIKLDYPLTDKQLIATNKLMEYLKLKNNVLVFAACGAGKTEIVMEPIKYYLNEHKKVCFAISRRQVVLEIRERLAKAFTNMKVICVCEGHTRVIDGDIIVCTMHQLHRYPNCFDLLIMDEVDAFPYKNNDVLHAIAHHSSLGQVIYLSATPDLIMLKEVKENKLKMVELFQRPHKHPLVEPTIRQGILLYRYYMLYRFLKDHHLNKIQVLIYVPTRAMAHKLANRLNIVYRVKAITSTTSNKDEIIKEFHEHKYEALVCTTILERGITIKGVDIVILDADHLVFDCASLIQIIGRVGRSIDKPSGEGLFIIKRRTGEVNACISTIKRMNLNA